ncbi:DUF1186 domain-containing protein, partial [Chloroflexota bacterium]
EQEDYMAHMYAMYLLAQFREERAYAPLVNLFSIPGETVMILVGDIVTEDLGRIFASVSGGDISQMAMLAENEQANEYVRSAALRGMVALVARGEKSHDEVLAYYQSLFREKLLREEDFVWSALVSVSNELYPDIVYDDIKQTYQDYLVDPFFISLDDVEKTLALDKEKVLENLKTDQRHTFIDDTIKELEGWACFRPPKQPQVANPVVRKKRKVGRNEPCPCGSGQKYKRCCGKRN